MILGQIIILKIEMSITKAFKGLYYFLNPYDPNDGNDYTSRVKLQLTKRMPLTMSYSRSWPKV